MNNAPCLNCKDRHILCHSSCTKYLSFKEKRNKISEKRAEEFDYNCYLNHAISRMKGAGYGKQNY